MRCYLWNRQIGISVSRRAYVDKTAKLDLNPVGLRITNPGIINISEGCLISEGVVLTPWQGRIVLEENVFLGSYCVLLGAGGITIGKNSMIAAHSVISASNHGFSDLERPMWDQPLICKGVSIGEDVWLGAGVKVLDGVTIGKGCVVGAGAVVNKSLPPYSVAVGVPAKIIRRRIKVDLETGRG
jgi:acetyltransferase-like isoleucine patch superfamily enzyme